MPSVVITIPRKGLSTGREKVSVDGVGFTGTGCTALTNAFTHALGSVERETLKPEFHIQEEQQERLTN